MKKISLPLGAIDRNKYSGASHAFNLRLKDGAIRNVGKPTETSVGNNVDYIHTSAGVNEYRNLLQINNGDTTTVYYVGNLNTGETFSPPQEFRINAHTNEVRHIGNTLIFLTDDGIYYALFKNGSYSLLGKKPPEPKIRFKVEKGSEKNIYDNASDLSAAENQLYKGVYFHKTNPPAYNEGQINTLVGKAANNDEKSLLEMRTIFTDHLTGCYNKAVSRIYDNGILPAFPMFLRYAVRLYDGSYIYQSPPLLIADNNGKGSFYYCPFGGMSISYDNIGGDQNAFFVFPKYKDGRIDYSTWEDGRYKYSPRALSSSTSSQMNFYVDINNRNRSEVISEIKNKLNNNSGLRYILDGFDVDNTYCGRWKFNDAMGFSDTETIDSKYLAGSYAALKTKALSFIFESLPNLSEWEDVVSSVDIFISKPQVPFKVGDTLQFPNTKELTICTDETDGVIGDWFLTAISNNWPPQEYTDKEIYNSVSAESAFFLLKSIPLDKLSEFNDNGFHSLAEEIHTYMPVIEQQRTLPDDNYSRNDYIPQTSLVLNQSLHIGDIKTVIFKGFTPDEYTYYAPDNERAKKYIKGYSQFQTSESSEIGSASNTSMSDAVRVVSPMVFVPMADATKINISLLRIENSTYYKDDFNLRLNPHNTLNGTYHLDENLNNLLPNKSTTLADEEGFVIPTDNNITKTEHNLVMVSEGSNPFFFDFKQTNYVGTSRIVAMAAATTALSSGQFGRFPLYVFTADGVYSLYMNDEGKYVSAHSVSADILLDKHKLCPITSAVVFATRQGLKALNGSQSTLLSAQLDGHAHDYSADDRPYHNPQLQAFLNGYQVSDFIDYLSAETTEVHYSYPYDEVWVVDTQKNYAYIYDLRSRAWMCRDTADMSNIRAFKILDDYPNLYLHHNNKLYDVATESQTEMLPFLYISNPQGGLDFIKYNNFLLGDYLAGCNLIDFKIFAGNNPFRVCKALSAYYFGPKHEFTGIHLNRIPSSVRYVQFAVKGHADDVCLSALNADISGNNYENTK